MVTRTPTRSLLLATLSALTLAACAAGPGGAPTLKPAPVTAGAFVSDTGGAVSATPLPADWWRLYNDPVLDGLVRDALAANTDIRQAAARIERARAGVRGARADRLPSVGLSASGGYSRSPEDAVPPGTDRDGLLLSGGANLQYEVDLFGRVSKGIAASRADLAAAQADADAVRVIVVADTTQAYADAASAAARIAVSQGIVDLLDQRLKLTRRRHDAGLEDGLAVARIEGLRQQRAAAIPQLEAERSAALFALATLTGRGPADLPPISAARNVPLEIATPLPIGEGRELLARRPDVRAAEQRLAGDAARIGVATADLYPRITLGGSLTSSASSLAGLFSAGPLGLFLGPLINWAFPNEGARARVDAANADARGSLAAFDGTVLTALQEAETALSTYGRALERRQALAATVAAAQKAARIVRAQNREGVINSLDTLDAERTLAEAQAALADQDALVSRSQIAVFRALGGGWEAGAQVAAR